MKKEILIVDDEPDIRFILSNILKEKNFNIREAANFDQAIYEINKKLPDLAIMDVKLDKADKDGVDLLKLLMNKDKAIPVIMISAHATINLATESIKIGAYEFIEKPFSNDKIINYVNRALEARILKNKKILLRTNCFTLLKSLAKVHQYLKSKKLLINYHRQKVEF